MIHQIKGRRPELKYSDFAILYRSNQLSRQLEQSLRAASLPYQVYGGQQFYQRREIKDAVAYLKIIVNPRDDQSLLRIIGTPPRGLGAKVVNDLKERRMKEKYPMTASLRNSEFLASLSKAAAAGAKEFTSACDNAAKAFESPGQLAAKVHTFLTEVGYIGGLQRIYKDISDAEKRRDNVDEFISAIAQFESKQPGPALLSEFLESFALLEEENQDEKDENSNAVVLSTIHAAKGLEFPVVFIAAMEHDIFPHERALAERSGDEELRLFYVALTRAKEDLFLIRSRIRMFRGLNRPAKPSEFLPLLGETAEHKSVDDLLSFSSKEDTLSAFKSFYESLNL
jgi:superfamily I DNA/RNA helicase